MGDYSSTIAAAVEQQTATTAGMAHSVVRAAEGTGSIANAVTAVAAAADTTTGDVDKTRQATADLTHLNGRLQDLVTRFAV